MQRRASGHYNGGAGQQTTAPAPPETAATSSTATATNHLTENSTASDSHHGYTNGNGNDSIAHGNGNSNDTNGQHNASQTQQDVFGFYRRSKACIACRRQKIKCLMDNGSAPCRRCQRKKLSCVVNNRGMRPLADENRLPFLDAVLQDLETVHSTVETVLGQLGLPSMAPLQIGRFVTAHSPNAGQTVPMESQQTEEVNNDREPEAAQANGPSCDNSPRLSPKDDGDLSTVPIRSMYHLTKLSSLRSPAASDESPTQSQSYHNRSQHSRSGNGPLQPQDLISRGKLTLDEAERLFRLYMDRLDNYMYGVTASRYSDLQTMRRSSPILTAAVLTVAAMHDAGSNTIYPMLSEEFDKLVAASVLERRIDRDHLRALCVASYWRNGTSWVLSGVATRRATEFDIMSHYNQLGKEGVDDEDAADFVRVWYLIFICDQHLSTLYERPCSGRQDAAITGWQALVRRPSATAGDQRLASQVSLLMMVQEIRELFGSERPGGSVGTGNGMPTSVSSVVLTQIRGFARQLDQWVAHWPPQFPEYQQGFGAFPRKGLHFHGNFAKLYLYSQAFRGLGASPVPPQLSECAHKAVAAATTIIEMIVIDDDVRAGLCGLPSYVQSMIGFACMFLARLVSMHGDMMVERSYVISLISRLRHVYHTTPVGKWHLAYLMPSGLDRILAMLHREQTDIAPVGWQSALPTDTQGMNGDAANRMVQQEGIMDDTNMGFMNGMDDTMASLDPYFLMDSGMNLAASHHLQDGFSFFSQGI